MFEPRVDLQEVEQFGFIDLRDSFEKGIVSGAASFEQFDFNEVSEPGALIGRAQDSFESLRQAQYVHEQLSHAKNKQNKQTAEKQVDNVSVDVNAE